MQKARTLAVPTVCWVAPMHQISVEGFCFANVSATRFICASGTPVTRSTSCRIPLLGFLADVIHAVDALLDELLVFPAILEDVPEQPVNYRNVGAVADTHIFGRVRSRARHARFDHEDVGAVELLAFKDVLQRHRDALPPHSSP